MAQTNIKQERGIGKRETERRWGIKELRNRETDTERQTDKWTNRWTNKQTEKKKEKARGGAGLQRQT